MSVKQTLIDARATLSDPAAWRKSGLVAQSRYDFPIAIFPGWNQKPLTEHPDAKCFCLDGAVLKHSPDNDTYMGARAALCDQLKEVGYGNNSHVWFNDFPSRKHEEVLDLLDRTIANVT